MKLKYLTDNREFSRSRYFRIYTVVFFVMCALMFSWFYLANRTFIWNVDGWAQHYRALVYYAKYLRGIIRGVVFDHSFAIQNWSFSFGEGNDILSALHYYVIGDPFSIGCVLVPTKYMYLYFDLMIIARLYCAGAAFSWLCIELKQNRTVAMLAGSITYVFCFWALFNVNRHPYFLDPLIWFPIIVVGVERIINGKRPTVFIVAVFLAAVSNFYFFYIIALVTVAYVVMRLAVKYRKDIKQALEPFFKIAGGAVFGVVMGAVIILPMLWTFIGDSRLSADHPFRILYPLAYYSRLPLKFISSDDQYWLCMGFAVPALIALYVLFKKRGRGFMLKVLFAACALVLALPPLGQLFNGFAYATNRWSWALALLAAFTLTVLWEELLELDAKDLGGVFLFICCYFAVCMLFNYSRVTRTFATLCFAFIFIGVIAFVRSSVRLRSAAALAVVAVNLFCNSLWLYSVNGSGYATEAMDAASVSGVFANEMSAVKEYADGAGDTEFYRVSGRHLTSNGSVLAGVSSTQYYWSISNAAVAEYRAALGMPETIQNQYKGYDDHAALLALSSSKYYTLPAWDVADTPYGVQYLITKNAAGKKTRTALSKLEKETSSPSEAQQNAVKNMASADYKIYKNTNALPLSYSYGGYITRDEWNALSMPERERAMLTAAVLDAPADRLPHTQYAPQGIECEYAATANGGIVVQDGSFVVTSPNASVTFSCDGAENSETFFVITGLDFDASSEYDLYKGSDTYDPLGLYNGTSWSYLSSARKNSIIKTGLFWSDPINVNITFSSGAVTKTLVYTTPESPWYSGLSDFSVNLGYSETGVKSFTVKFERLGVYSFESLKVVSQPMNGFAERVNALRENTMTDVSVKPDSITGTFETEKPALLCFSVPYSRGWKATVDGHEQEIIITNVKNIGLELGPGDHRIELHYSTPFLKEGAIISAAGILLFVLYALLGIRKRKK